MNNASGVTSSVEGAGCRLTPTFLDFFSFAITCPSSLEVSLFFTLETSHFRLVILVIPAQVKSLYVYLQYLHYSDKRTLVALVTGFCGCPLSEISQKPQLSCIMTLHPILDQCSRDDNKLYGFATNSHANFNLHRITAHELGFRCQLPLDLRTLSAHLAFTTNEKVGCLNISTSYASNPVLWKPNTEIN